MSRPDGGQPAQGRPRRFPSWVYGSGVEPDYRFSLANERTFLAWLRTSLGLIAAGGAVAVIDGPARTPTGAALAVSLTVVGGLTALLAWPRWAQVERAMRRDRPLPGGAAVLLGGAVAVAAIAGLVVLVT